MSMGRYEIIYILAPNTPDETMNELVDRFESEVVSGGGVLLRVEKWGRKKLAYEVRKFREGFFVLFLADCEGALVDELARRFRMTDAVIKFMTVRIDEELKRAGKMAKDEPLGAPRETERVDRSRRSTPKPTLRGDDGTDDEDEAEERENGDGDAVEPEEETAAADQEPPDGDETANGETADEDADSEEDDEK